MVNIRSKGEKTFDVFNILFMLFLTFIFAYPLWHVLCVSFGDVVYSTQMGFRFFPVGERFTWAGYGKIIHDADLVEAYSNTVLRVVAGVPLTLAVTYMASYTMSRKNLPLKNLLLVYFMVPMFFGGGLVPSYLNIRDLGLLENKWVWILPGMFSTYNMLIARNFIAGLPHELEEAAAIDGAHPVRIMIQIMLPLSAPILAVLGLWSAVGHWNAWYDAMLYTKQPGNLTLQLFLRRLLIDPPDAQYMTNITVAQASTETVKMASVVVALVPIMCAYPFVQKYFTKGVLIGAVKG